MPTVDREEFRSNYAGSLPEPPKLKVGGGLDVSAQAFVPKQPPQTRTPPPSFMEHISKAAGFTEE